MEKYDVETRPEALKDLDEIVDSLSDDSVQSAIRHHDLIVEKISGLSEMPRRFPLARDIQLRARDFRTMYVKNYVVIYIIRDNKVIIRRILYAKSQFEKLLIKQEDKLND